MLWNFAIIDFRSNTVPLQPFLYDARKPTNNYFWIILNTNVMYFVFVWIQLVNFNTRTC